ncbi:tRNA endonuclease ANKZF1 isoform X3 [Danio rerio]|uniref:tRNA endonuclease ANKZF1 isoform X3 n=1 Tax=Danio rerio TaxID=7955 RepID=A0AC58GFW4_DANRE|nr:ankyrin repeat and zinc finger domain-containing protein 1 isoform X4 [Danio rerio]|eukprot:XP_009302806.1 ankyrin repeat and zinc finger domain-containing protein 1 isoform X4 [Danio rerio]
MFIKKRLKSPVFLVHQGDCGRRKLLNLLVIQYQTLMAVLWSVPAEGEDAKEESSGEDDSGTLETVEVTLGTLVLREHEIYPNKKKRRKRKEKREDSSSRETNEDKADDENMDEGELEVESDSKEMQRKSRGRRKPKGKKPQPEEDEVDESWEYSLRDALYTACKTGDIQSLRSLLHLPEDEESRRERTTEEDPASQSSDLLNKPIDSAGFTLLHVASAAGQKSVIRLLMDAGSDPANKTKKGQTPYGVAPEKDTRNVFRKYMAEHPHKYDYTKAQVPGPLTEDIESKKAEKKKAQKAARKQKEKEQKEEKVKKQQEEEEKKRFTALSDREKRALAAERRLAEHLATTGGALNNIRRCFLCGESLLGKIPFEYLDYSFCTPRCVQAHRKANAAARP